MKSESFLLFAEIVMAFFVNCFLLVVGAAIYILGAAAHGISLPMTVEADFLLIASGAITLAQYSGVAVRHAMEVLHATPQTPATANLPDGDRPGL